MVRAHRCRRMTSGRALHKSVTFMSKLVTKIAGFAGDSIINTDQSITELLPVDAWPDADPQAGVARHVLIVERDPTAAGRLQNGLLQVDFSVSLDSGFGAFATVERHNPHLVVLDWNLPGVRSPELLQQLKSLRRRERPRVLVVADPCSEQQVLNGFQLGVDDFVFKPYSVAEVVARVRAILRSTTAGNAASATRIAKFWDLELDAEKECFSVRGRELRLRRLEFRLLDFLMQRPERVFTRKQLLAEIWGESSLADGRAVDVTVQRTRKALQREGCDGYLQTVRGVGYRLCAPLEAISRSGT